MPARSSKYCDYCDKHGHNVKDCWLKLQEGTERAENFLGEIAVTIERELTAKSKKMEGEKDTREEKGSPRLLPDARTLQAIGKRLVDEQTAEEATQARKREHKRAKRQRVRRERAKRKNVELKGGEVPKSSLEKKREVTGSIQRAA